MNVLNAQHRIEVSEWTSRYGEAIDARESALDVIAKAMADLATASGAPAGGALNLGLFGSPDGSACDRDCGRDDRGGRPSDLARRRGPAQVQRLRDLLQELPQLFEKATIVVDGSPRTVGRMRPDALEGLEVTPELQARITRVRANLRRGDHPVTTQEFSNQLGLLERATGR